MELKKRDFIQIIDKNNGVIRSLCRVYYVSHEDQKDAFQDIVLQLWKSFDTFRGESQISTWIYAVSLNTLLAKNRKDKKNVITAPLDTCHNIVSSALADDDLELLSIILQSLKDLDKAILVLHLEGYRHKEIADILKVSASNVSTRFNRIKSQLKTKLKVRPYATRRP